MKVIYIAGPFRGPNHWVMAENVRNAERWALEVANAGHMPLCPHANTAHFHGCHPDQFMIDGTAELLRRCDGAVFIPGWIASAGSRGEFGICAKEKIPACDLDALTDPKAALAIWLRRFETKT